MRSLKRSVQDTSDEVRAAVRDTSGLFAVATIALVVIALAVTVLALKAK